MGFKNLFNRKNKKTTENGVVVEEIQPMNTTPVEPIVRIEEELEQVFKKFDVNGDGKISSSELGSIMRSLGHRPTEDELEKMIVEVDAFSVFDIDKNGSITADELQNVLGSLGEECSLGECRRMIAGVDQDRDGMISFEEFKVMMMMGSD